MVCDVVCFQKTVHSDLFSFVDGVWQFYVFTFRHGHSDEGSHERGYAEHDHGRVLAEILHLKKKKPDQFSIALIAIGRAKLDRAIKYE